MLEVLALAVHTSDIEFHNFVRKKARIPKVAAWQNRGRQGRPHPHSTPAAAGGPKHRIHAMAPPEQTEKSCCILSGVLAPGWGSRRGSLGEGKLQEGLEGRPFTDEPLQSLIMVTNKYKKSARVEGSLKDWPACPCLLCFQSVLLLRSADRYRCRFFILERRGNRLRPALSQGNNSHPGSKPPRSSG
jgi:hypothetical protein